VHPLIDPLSGDRLERQQQSWRDGRDPSVIIEMLWILGIFAGAVGLVAVLATI
jgi:hypothetical protein